MKENIFKNYLFPSRKRNIRFAILKLLFGLVPIIMLIFSCTNKFSKETNLAIAKYKYLLSVFENNNNKEYFQAADYTIANAPLYELNQLNPDSVIRSISTSLNVWNNIPWKSCYSKSDFEEYILPYRICNEPLELSWKWVLPQKINISKIREKDIFTAAVEINKKVIINNSPDIWKNPIQSYSSLLISPFGKCDDRAIFAVMAMRSNGIPSAFECIPCWGNANNGHSFCTVIQPNGKLAVFQNSSDDGLNVEFAYKTPKIYRRMFTKQTNTFLYKHKDIESFPAFFSNFDKMDVTDKHKINQRDISINLNYTKNKVIYLSVFSPKEWIPVAYAENMGTYAHFTKVGTGENSNSRYLGNTGNGILYLPSIYENNEIHPVANPIIASDKQIKEIKCNPTQTEEVTLHRKYPLSKRVTDFANYMQGGIFEGANRIDFLDASELYYIDSTPLTRMQRVSTTSKQKFKYFRYRKPQGVFSLSELRIFNDSGEEIVGKLISCNALSKDSQVEKIIDNNILSFYTLPSGIDIWIGLALKYPQTITSVEFCPRTDDNDISPGDQYELFYWNNKWISLEKKQADDYFIKFKNVPCNALLWLRDLSKGKEERPFTINNGVQIWW